MKNQVIFAIVAFLASALAVAVFADELPLIEQAKECCQQASANDSTTNCQYANCPHAQDKQKNCSNCSGCKAKSEEMRKNCPKASAAKTDADVAPIAFDAAQPVGTPATCPVMMNGFDIKEDTLHSEVDGKHVYFCCQGCKSKFDADPEKYLKQE